MSERRAEDIGMSGYLSRADMDAATSEAAVWIEHDGNGMPVDGDIVVSIRLRDGTETPARWRTPATHWNWKWQDERSLSGMKSGDIIAYRVVPA